MKYINDREKRINDFKSYPSIEERTSVYKNEFNDYEDFKNHIKKLEETFPNFVMS